MTVSSDGATTAPPSSGTPDELRRAIVRRIETVIGSPPSHGNRVDVLRNGVRIFPAMLDAIDGARSTVDLVTFVYWSGDIADRFADALVRAARRGCRVRVLLDAIGARRLDPELVRQMTEAGCSVRWFRQLHDGATPGDVDEANHRTHRKVLVVDQEVAFTGGVGIADEWDGDARAADEWRDTHLRVTGPAVAGLFGAFIENWSDEGLDEWEPCEEIPVDTDHRPGSSTCFVVRGSAPTGASDMWRLTITLLDSATERLRIATAYFNPDDRMVRALLEASARGVDVTVLVPGPHADKRVVQIAGEHHYQELLDGGVAICSYQPSMMHAKVITVDGVVATVGSANFNRRSVLLDEEANLVVADPEVVAVLDADLDTDFGRSERLDPERWRDRSLTQRIAERITDVADRWF